MSNKTRTPGAPAVRLKNTDDLAAYNLGETGIQAVGEKYAVGITPHVLSTMKSADMSDPVAKQYVPDIAELNTAPQELLDPIGDDLHSPVPGLVHRYPDRVLLKLAHICAVYCRYCFRREMVGPAKNKKGREMMSADDLARAFNYIRSKREIWEVILTGGDPLVLSPARLAPIIDTLSSIDHVRILRIHTRIPVADPARITDALCDKLAAFAQNKAVYVAIHINHAQEITPAVKTALDKLHKAGCTLLSQSVLLRGVNDNADTLEDLFRELTALRVKPYYIHHPDMAPGTGHFRLSIKEGQAIMRVLLGRVSGLCQPHYMLDIPGGYGKIQINPHRLDQAEDGKWIVEDFQGNRHYYEDA